MVKGVISEESILISEGVVEKGTVRKLRLVMVFLNTEFQRKRKEKWREEAEA